LSRTPIRLVPRNGRYRRFLVVAGYSGEGRFSEPTAAARLASGNLSLFRITIIYVLASRLRASWMEARVPKMARISAGFSKSLARRRFRPNQEKLRSTTRRRSRTTNQHRDNASRAAQAPHPVDAGFPGASRLRLKPSLFGRFNSLLGGLGNFPDDPRDSKDLAGSNRYSRVLKPVFASIFPCTGNRAPPVAAANASTRANCCGAAVVDPKRATGHNRWRNPQTASR
jgi:hypothetical protein